MGCKNLILDKRKDSRIRFYNTETKHSYEYIWKTNAISKTEDFDTIIHFIHEY